jgi:cytochrome c5
MNPRSFAWCLTLELVLVAAAAPLFAVQSSDTQTDAAHQGKRDTKTSQSKPADQEGERVFDQNCARCHNAPDSFSPRITATIVRHMRVRANLSAHDEEALLHFFNQ